MNNMLKKHLILISIYLPLILLLACTVEPKAIDYGNDGCDYCSMTIVDQQHAAELVTKKGKVYKFDAIECMLNFEHESSNEYTYSLLTDYANPGNLIDAKSATYLISKNIPSPMGAFLSAFEYKDSATVIQERHDGSLYNWDQIKEAIVNK